jgi:hypothetical protein
MVAQPSLRGPRFIRMQSGLPLSERHRSQPHAGAPFAPLPRIPQSPPDSGILSTLAPLCYNPIRRSPRKRPDLLCSLTTENSHHPQWDWVRSVILPIPRPAQTTARPAKPDPLVLLNWLRSCKIHTPCRAPPCPRMGLGSFRHFYLRSSTAKTFFPHKSAQRGDKALGRQVFGERHLAG